MKFRISFLASVLVLGTLVNSCKEDPPAEKTDEQINTELLSKAWIQKDGANAITVAANDVSDIWDTAGFALTFTDGNYTTTGSAEPEVWPANGSWEFGTDANTLVRSDGIEIAISVTETTLVMKFDYSANGGRLNGIEGAWVFNMVPQ